ncbi:1-deoxy-D-xylulose-5-phosphate synthase [Actinokineospora iranica]|uniref:1-deoxy-D-xylulose-5-phosphate synthase n=1 Tax=Actinokineospora iranica TaxID=1271860 RepID=A0A1G6VW85_9PSEU|nr:1-deoxy-D-xylulose-5-phosphate synthase [Actinokineospora iranica]SDD57075.1 1-deoxy-D-xylulose-5-phosphate synthase [Actinokineospora iranica]
MTCQVARFPLVESISEPADLLGLPRERLGELAEQIRGFLVENVSRTGGHLGPNLGVVELSIALHRVFESPRDAIVFDTGHQSYAHKVLTGRWREFDSLRQEGGLSGYPCRNESEHDIVENSHASTALSYADGLAKAFELRAACDRRVVAVVGDGALTGGMAWEALNNIAAASHRPVVIVLNDNGRSYAPTVGALAEHLATLRTPPDPRAASDPVRTLFETLGLAYLGPIDGHDIDALEQGLRRAAAMRCAVVVHCVTRKGNGHSPAEQDEADCLHAVGPATGAKAKTTSWTEVFGAELLAAGAERDDLVCLTAAMLRPTGLHPFARRFPQRVFDVGLAEQHAVTSAAGLALGGLRPVVAIYSTFLNRGFDQVLMDIALHRLPVTFVLDRAGVTGADGPSHHGMWDSSLLPLVPGLRLAEPRDPRRLRELLRECLCVDDGPTALRYPKGAGGPDLPAVDHLDGVDLLRAAPGSAVLLIAAGSRAHACVRAADTLTARGIPVTVADPRWTAPLPPALAGLAARHALTLTVEDNVVTGGMGQRLAHLLVQRDPVPRLRCLALPARFLPHGDRGDILRRHGLDAAGIVDTVLRHLHPSHCHKRHRTPARST